MCKHRFSLVLLLLGVALTTGFGALGASSSPVGLLGSQSASAYGSAATGIIALGNPGGQSTYAAGVGDTAADFTLPEWFTRQPVSLYDFAGKIVLLDFSAYWCPYCRTAASELEPKIQQYYAQRGGNPGGIPVQVILMNVEPDNPANTTAFIQQYGVELALDDSALTVYNVYGLGGIPLFVIVNGAANTNYGQWEILYQDAGYAAGYYNTFRSVIDSVMLMVDGDGDGVIDQLDNCRLVANPGQEDGDSDGVGDVCDNCPSVSNSDQADMDNDGQGDVCDGDRDGDGFPNAQDNCPWIANGDQFDSDGDGVGEVCDNCPHNAHGVPVDATGCSTLNVPGDFDRDGDVDQADFGRFQVCLNGPTTPQNDPGCAGAKLNGDAMVDRYDLVLFRGCMTGVGVAGDPNCAQ